MIRLIRTKAKSCAGGSTQKRVINPNAQPAENNVKIDEATAMKLKLIAEAKEHEARRRQEEEEKERLRRQEREQEEKERLARQAAEEAKKAEMVKEIKSAQITAPVVEAEEKSFKTKDKNQKIMMMTKMKRKILQKIPQSFRP